MLFDLFSVLCKHHLCLVPKQLVTPKETRDPLSSLVPVSLPHSSPRSWQLLPGLASGLGGLLRLDILCKWPQGVLRPAPLTACGLSRRTPGLRGIVWRVFDIGGGRRMERQQPRVRGTGVHCLASLLEF